MSKKLKTFAALAVASSALIGGHASAATCKVDGGGSTSKCSTSNITVKSGGIAYAFGYLESYTAGSGAKATFNITHVSLGKIIKSSPMACKFNSPAFGCKYSTVVYEMKNTGSVPVMYRASISSYSAASSDKGHARATIY